MSSICDFNDYVDRAVEAIHRSNCNEAIFVLQKAHGIFPKIDKEEYLQEGFFQKVQMFFQLYEECLMNQKQKDQLLLESSSFFASYYLQKASQDTRV